MKPDLAFFDEFPGLEIRRCSFRPDSGVPLIRAGLEWDRSGLRAMPG
jgi:hypothetical protein